jgi:hypothetical protein
VLRGAVVDNVSVAPELPVGAAHLGGFEEGVQLAAGGIRAAAGVAVATEPSPEQPPCAVDVATEQPPDC